MLTTHLPTAFVCDVKAYLFIVLACSVAGCGSCASDIRSLDFTSLSRADRIDVVTPVGEPLVTISDGQKVQNAAAFAERHRDGWREDWVGPRSGLLRLEFYRRGEYLGGYGVGMDYIVSAREFLFREASPEGIRQLMTDLGVEFPPKP